jgi:hypothetical protein
MFTGRDVRQGSTRTYRVASQVVNDPCGGLHPIRSETDVRGEQACGCSGAGRAGTGRATRSSQHRLVPRPTAGEVRQKGLDTIDRLALHWRPCRCGRSAERVRGATRTFRSAAWSTPRMSRCPAADRPALARPAP